MDQFGDLHYKSAYILSLMHNSKFQYKSENFFSDECEFAALVQGECYAITRVQKMVFARVSGKILFYEVWNSPFFARSEINNVILWYTLYYHYCICVCMHQWYLYKKSRTLHIIYGFLSTLHKKCISWSEKKSIVFLSFLWDVVNGHTIYGISWIFFRVWVI